MKHQLTDTFILYASVWPSHIWPCVFASRPTYFLTLQNERRVFPQRWPVGTCVIVSKISRRELPLLVMKRTVYATLANEHVRSLFIIIISLIKQMSWDRTVHQNPRGLSNQGRVIIFRFWNSSPWTHCWVSEHVSWVMSTAGLWCLSRRSRGLWPLLARRALGRMILYWSITLWD